MNARDDLPIKVERVWLFGSYVHGEESVNDIDLVVETTGTVMWDDHRACLTAAIALGGGSWLSQSMANLPQEYITRRVIYGPRKDPRLAPTSLGDLCALACECRLAFDAGRGGEVDDPVLPRHPESKGRSRYAGGKRTMPSLLEDLPPEPILPFHLECADSYTFASDAAFAGYFASLSYVEGVQALRRLGDVGFIVEPVYLGYKARPSELLGWLEKCGPLDGRSRAVAWLGDGSGKPLVALLISRSMERSQSGGWAYVVDVLDVYAAPPQASRCRHRGARKRHAGPRGRRLRKDREACPRKRTNGRPASFGRQHFRRRDRRPGRRISRQGIRPYEPRRGFLVVGLCERGFFGRGIQTTVRKRRGGHHPPVSRKMVNRFHFDEWVGEFRCERFTQLTAFGPGFLPDGSAGQPSSRS